MKVTTIMLQQALLKALIDRRPTAEIRTMKKLLAAMRKDRGDD